MTWVRCAIVVGAWGASLAMANPVAADDEGRSSTATGSIEKPPPAGSRSSFPNVTGAVGLRAFLRLQRSDQAFANGMNVVFGPIGWWGPGIRVGLAVELGLGSGCATCWPVDSWTMVGVGPSITWDVWQTHRWGIVAGFEFRYFSGGRREGDLVENRTFYAPGLIWSLWRNWDLEGRWYPAGARAATSFDLFLAEWRGPVESSPVVGLGITLVVGGDLTARRPTAR